MQPTEATSQQIGALQGTVWAHRAEMLAHIHHLRRELLGRLAVIERKSAGAGRKLPWAQFGAMGLVALTSILGLIKPETAATILKSLLH